jgi:hypothetical protein
MRSLVNSVTNYYIFLTGLPSCQKSYKLPKNETWFEILKSRKVSLVKFIRLYMPTVDQAIACVIPKHKEEATDDIREKGERG